MEVSLKKFVDLFHMMYTAKYNVIFMGDIVNEFKRSDPFIFLTEKLPQAVFKEEEELHQALDDRLFKGFSFVKVSLLVWTLECGK